MTRRRLRYIINLKFKFIGEKNMKYKTEMHCHTSEVSRCALENASDTVEKYLKYGYSTVVLTNHLSPFSFSPETEKKSWKEKIDFFVDGYNKMKDAANGRLNVIFGVEMRLREVPNDYLIYGITPEFLYEHEDIYELPLSKVYPDIIYPDYLLIQAHPFRTYMMIEPPYFVDGWEVYNGHPTQSSHNDAVEIYASHYPNKHKTSGSDHHDADHFPAGGIETDFEIKTGDELLKVIRSGNYGLIKNEDIRLGKKRM